MSWARKFEKLGVADKVCPFNVDVTESMPFPQGHFDAIFCMGGTHYFEGTVDFAEWICGAPPAIRSFVCWKPVFQQGVYGGRTRRLAVGI